MTKSQGIGPALRKARVRAGLRQAEAARRARISRVSLSKLENGFGEPRLRTLRSLARTLGFTLTIGPDGTVTLTSERAR